VSHPSDAFIPIDGMSEREPSRVQTVGSGPVEREVPPGNPREKGGGGEVGGKKGGEGRGTDAAEEEWFEERGSSA